MNAFADLHPRSFDNPSASAAGLAGHLQTEIEQLWQHKPCDATLRVFASSGLTATFRVQGSEELGKRVRNRGREDDLVQCQTAFLHSATVQKTTCTTTCAPASGSPFCNDKAIAKCFDVHTEPVQRSWRRLACAKGALSWLSSLWMVKRQA